MSGYTDQRGNPITFDDLVVQVTEAVLANVIVLEEAGVPQGDIKMVVGRDGGTVVGGGAIFQTPLERPLSQEQGKALFDAFSALYSRYRQGHVDAGQLDRIRERHNVGSKVETVRQSLEP